MTAHCFGTEVLPILIDAGIDCIEHGTGLTEDLIDGMVAHGTALVPTAMQLNNFPQYADQAAEKFPAYAATIRDLHARRRDTIMAAYEAGVPIYAGTDAGGVLPHGGIAGEVAELAAYGIPAEDALGAASWRAREWLGLNATLDEGAPADFVVYDADPREDLTVLARPARVVLRGRSCADAPAPRWLPADARVGPERARRCHAETRHEALRAWLARQPALDARRATTAGATAHRRRSLRSMLSGEPLPGDRRSGPVGRGRPALVRRRLGARRPPRRSAVQRRAARLRGVTCGS